MKQLLYLFLLLGNVAMAQNSFNAIIKDETTKEPLIGATAIIKGTTIGATANIDGLLTIKNFPTGNQVVVFSFIGYESESKTVNATPNDTITVFLSSGEELEEVVVSATRSSRTIDEIPTRTEVIAAEELGEKAI